MANSKPSATWRTTYLRGRCAFAISLPMLVAPAICSAKHDIEFVAEHLPEVAMDNRYATLPVWDLGRESSAGNTYQVQAAFSRSTSGDLEIAGPLASLAFRRNVGANTQLGFFAFYDSLKLRADHDSRPLQTLFAPSTPIERPVDAKFSNLDGTATDFGAGLAWSGQLQDGFLGRHNWLAGVPPHALLAYPIPRRGIEGHITRPGFDIRGNTESAGNGKHFGDPSLTLGLTLTSAPAHFSVDIGTMASQALLERRIHRGIEQNVLLSFSWTR